MTKTSITALLLLVHFCVSSQNIFTAGNRIFYDSTQSSYTRYEIQGFKSNFVRKSMSTDEKTTSGVISVNFKGKPGRLGGPLLYNGEHILYNKRTYLDVNIGDPLYSIYYRVINNELDGLHYIDGREVVDNYTRTIWKTKRDQFVVIAGNIVDAPRGVEKGGYKIADEYTSWVTTGLNVDYFQSPFPSPKVHKEEDLYFDLELMVQIFIDDYKNHLLEFTRELAIWQQDDAEYENFIFNCFWPLSESLEKIEYIAVFEKLENGVIAKAFGIDDDNNVIIKVDPDQWLKADFANRWYILYHELGHDILNFRHGQGGRMMFNYPTKKYSWEEFFNDRDEMFLKALNKKYPQAKKDGIQPRWSNY